MVDLVIRWLVLFSVIIYFVCVGMALLLLLVAYGLYPFSLLYIYIYIYIYMCVCVCVCVWPTQFIYMFLAIPTLNIRYIK